MSWSTTRGCYVAYSSILRLVRSGDSKVRRPHFRVTSYYDNCFDLSFQILLHITIFVLDVLIVFIYLQVASHKQLLMRHVVGSPEYKQITPVLKIVERLRRITAQLPLEETDGANQEAPEDTGRPSTSSTRASHSHGQRSAPHQVVNRLGPPPPLHAPEFPLPPHASPAPEIPPRTAHAVPDLEIPLPTAHASFHPEIPSHTPHTFFDPAHLSFTPPSFDLGYDFS